MTRVRLSALVALVLFVASFVGAAAWKPSRHLANELPKLDLETAVPRTIGKWVIDEHVPVQLISPDRAAVLKAIYSQTLSRTYVNSRGERIMLSVAYGGDQSDATRAHRPEVCYPAQGFRIVWDSKSQVRAADRTFGVRQLLAQQGSRVEPITYWVVTGDEVATSGVEQKLAQLRYGIRGVVPDGTLVRVSTIEPDLDRGLAINARFIADLAQALPEGARVRLLGARTRLGA